MDSKRRQQRGFTLVELMIVVVIVAILAVIAIPSFSDQMRKARRSDAHRVLSQVAQSLEKCMSLYGTYNNGNCNIIDGSNIDSEERYYSVAVDSAPSTYTLTATPAAGGPQVNDDQCASITFNNTGTKGATDSGSGDSSEYCW